MLVWRSDTEVVVDGVEFALAPTDTRGGRAVAAETGALLLRKPRWMVERYAALRGVNPRRIVELGIYDGGSTALLAVLYRPERLVAVDITTDRAEALDRFIRTHDATEILHAHFGIDQADRAALAGIVDDEFDGPLDLVIDDASHLLDETTASFNLLFPKLRPGGLFVIEDWSWQHFNDEAFAEALLADDRRRAELIRRLESGDTPAPAVPLSRLILELVLTAAYAETIVAEITAVRGWTVVRRGPVELDDSFDIRETYGSLGRSLLA